MTRSSPPAELNLTYFDTATPQHGRARPHKFTGNDNFTFPSRSDLDVAEENASSQMDQRLAPPMLSMPTPRPGATPSLFDESSVAREHLSDPYDGSNLGVFLPPHPDAADHPSTPPRSTSVPGARDLPRSEELWAQLSRVLELQTDIARTHAEMESIGIGKGKAKLGESKDTGKKEAEDGSKTHGQFPTDPGSEEYDVEGEGVEVDDEETERNRAREEEFAKLADQFEGRKKSINEIMSKLDDLSKALTEFHALQEPELKLPPSRSESLAPGMLYESAPLSSTESAANLPGSLSRIAEGS